MIEANLGKREAHKMLNDRQDKYEGHEESEYHFSDEEVNYEIEHEESPQATKSIEPKETILNRLSQSKRMVLSVVVFLGLVLVVYKMVEPNSTQSSTEISPATVANQKQISNIPAISVSKPQAKSKSSTEIASAKATMQGAQQVNQSQTMSMQPVIPVVSSQPTAQALTPNVTSGTQGLSQVGQQATPVLQQESAVVSTPPLMPVQPTVGTQNSSSSQAVVSQSQNGNTIVPTEAQISTPPGMTTPLTAVNEKLVGQLQSEYAQKINDYEMQNKAIQDQLQTLSTRVATMETQMNQLIQVLLHQNQSNVSSGSAPSAAAAATEQQAAEETKVAYSVQAIIPGRAWLRSDNGETVTVAEGDVIKDLGRVTKIDPYDGVVEINTGTKVISLSYGNGG